MVHGNVLEKVTLDRSPDGTAVIRVGNDRLLDIEFSKGGPVAIHKPRKEPPVAVDATELLNVLNRLIAS